MDRQPKDSYRLSPKQATALRQLADQDWSFEYAQSVLQTTLGALYRRGYVTVLRNRFRISPQGRKALVAQSNAAIERGESTSHNPFARVIRELAEYTNDSSPKVVPIQRAKVA